MNLYWFTLQKLLEIPQSFCQKITLKKFTNIPETLPFKLLFSIFLKNGIGITKNQALLFKNIFFSKVVKKKLKSFYHVLIFWDKLF